MRNIVSFFAITLLLVGCSQAEEIDHVILDKVDFDPVTKTELVDMTQEESMVFNNGLTDFGLKVYPFIAGEENFIFSPYSIAYALNILAMGTDGNSKSEIYSALGINGISEEKIKTYYYRDRTRGANVSTFNSIWAESDKTLLQSYRQDCMRWFDAYSANVDFSDRHTSELINGWCYDATHGMIPEIVSPYQMDNMTSIMIVNTLYFTGKWAVYFRDLSDFDFTDRNGEKRSVSAITSIADLPYFENDTYKATSVPFDDAHRITLILPKNGGINLCEAVEEFNSNSKLKKVTVTFPSFSIQSDGTGCIDALDVMGVHDIFNAFNANFSRMTEEKGMFVSSLFQNAKIIVDKDGCEAAAATVVEMEVTDSEEDPIELERVDFIADHPFYFVISGNAHPILFIGQMML